MNIQKLHDGQIFLVDKPLGWSSFQAVNKLKWAILKNFGLKHIKIGHAGTLDPLATGLLVICVGKATKQIPQIQEQSKVYTGTFTLGATTPSYDMETQVDQRFSVSHINEKLLHTTKSRFTGEIAQYPPVFSAIKKEGKRLYEFARNGETVELPLRKVRIYQFDILRIQLPEVDFRVECSKGTYIRSLAHDFGQALSSGAYLSALRREQIGDFSVKDALIPDKWAELIALWALQEETGGNQ